MKKLSLFTRISFFAALVLISISIRPAMAVRPFVTDDARVRRNIDSLKAIPLLSGNVDLAKAASSYERFNKLRMEILKLSRENTNVQSLAISLDQKRKVTLLCQEALNALKQAILEEPVRGVTYGPPARPR